MIQSLRIRTPRPTHPSTQWASGALCTGLKRPGREADHSLNLLNPTGYVMHQQFNIQQLYALSTLYLCVLYLFENKQRLVPLTA